MCTLGSSGQQSLAPRSARSFCASSVDEGFAPVECCVLVPKAVHVEGLSGYKNFSQFRACGERGLKGDA